MNIQVIRIDDRLIHGQVVVGWFPALEIGAVVVINDAVAANKVKREMMSLGVPARNRVEFYGVEESASKIEADPGHENAMLLFENPTDVLRYLQGGAKVTTVNVGGLHFADDKREIHTGYFVSERDVAALKELVALGVGLEIRALPGQNPVNLNALLAKTKGRA
jgi:mannose/fructose/N-acetylgalactosamine-specific phosphotransferase system component IIB